MDAVHGLLVDLMRVPELRGRFRGGLTEHGPVNALAAMMHRAAERGEIDPARLTARVVALPLDLLRDAFLIEGAVPSDRVVAEVLDEVVLPLLRAPCGSWAPIPVERI
jgi:hypothetical protein